jgi:hypothetical protein
VTLNLIFVVHFYFHAVLGRMAHIF